MIVSRPKRNTIFALGVSTLICGFGSLYFMRQVLAEPDGVWRYIVLGILLLCTSILIYKLLFNYKVIDTIDFLTFWYVISNHLKL